MRFKNLSLRKIRALHGRAHEQMKDNRKKRIEKKSAKVIKQIKDFHKNERCFIIGNGPSLRIEDLERIKNEITFATNRIYHVFDQTTWRPTYYCVQDFRLIQNSYREINEIQAKRKFVGCSNDEEYELLDSFTFIKLYIDSFYPDLPQFSDDLKLGIYEGFTVTYMCIQIAIYMGFREIVLLGIDHNYSVELLPDGSIKTNDIEKDHFDSKDKVDNLPQPAKTTLAYIAAKQYCEKNGINVYNATRGGKLEVFERKSLEKIL